MSLWLKRAVTSDFPASWCEQAIAALCGDRSEQPPAVAAVTYREDFGTAPQGWCLRADPVHLRADTRGLILFDSASFTLAVEESRALTDTLAAHLAEDNWRLVCKHPRRWYLLGDRPQHLETPPLPLVRGTPVAATPYSGEDASRWMGRLNELQMLMHNHAVNHNRAIHGQVAINSVWLWGGGKAQVLPELSGTQILADNVFARGLARACGVPALKLPDNAGQILASTPEGGSLFVVLEHCRDAAAYEDVTAWQAAVERLERDWFAPLIAGLTQRHVDALQLFALDGRCYRLTRANLRAFWKGAGDYRSQPGFRHPAGNRV